MKITEEELEYMLECLDEVEEPRRWAAKPK
jgi:hypothetical protein